MRRVFFIAGSLGALGVAAACGLDLVGLEPNAITTVADAGLVVDSGPMTPNNDGGIEAAAPCGPARAGPTMIDIGGYCIDTTEVTQAQYAAFMDDVHSGYDAGSQPVCAWKNGTTSYDVPNQASGYPCYFTPKSTPNVAVVCVDWCDADAYCRWAGKRLCGAIGGGAVAWSGDENIDAGRDQWYRACKKVSADPHACNTTERGIGRAVDAGAFFACGSGGIFDLNGNVDEQEDGCQGDAGKSDRCRYRGGSWYYAPSQDVCEHRYGESEATRGGRFADVGFRCCSQ